jgi:hypothetical protein
MGISDDETSGYLRARSYRVFTLFGEVAASGMMGCMGFWRDFLVCELGFTGRPVRSLT